MLCHPAETLPEFIAHHTVEMLCLPCKLVLPQSSSGGAPCTGQETPAGMKQALQTGVGEKACGKAACMQSCKLCFA